MRVLKGLRCPEETVGLLFNSVPKVSQSSSVVQPPLRSIAHANNTTLVQGHGRSAMFMEKSGQRNKDARDMRLPKPAPEQVNKQ